MQSPHFMPAPQENDIDSLLQSVAKEAKAQNTAYDLSWPLMCYALKRDQKEYHAILELMEPALASMPKEQLTTITWLRGRIAFSAGMIGDIETLNAHTPVLKAELQEVQEQKKEDKLSAWGHGYAAAVDPGVDNIGLIGAIEAYKGKKVDGNAEYEGGRFGYYKTLKIALANDPEKEEKLLQERGRIIWVQLLVLRAAAGVSEEKYNEVFADILALSGENDILVAIEKNLLHQNDDFPLWGFAAIKEVAAMKKDASLFERADQKLAAALTQARSVLPYQGDKLFKAKADLVMAEFISARADALYKKLQPASTEAPRL